MFEKLRERLSGIAKQDNEEIKFRDFDEAEDVTLADEVKKKAEEPAPVEKSSIEGNNLELKVVRPESISEVGTIADHLIDGCTVVLNVELLDKPQITRMLDFLRGVTYTIDGEIKSVAKATYIITSKGINIKDNRQ